MLKAKAFDGEFGSDVADQMNEFFQENPNLKKENIHHFQLKKGTSYNGNTQELESHVTALILYDETRKDRVTRGTQ